jgi:hypothetical protein
MNRFAAFLLSCLLLAGTGARGVDPPASVPGERAAAIGLWMIPASARAVSRGDERALPGITLFHYDGEFVTLRLVTLKGWMWRSEDDFYRLETRWVGGKLQCHLPFASFEPVATFQGDHFVYQDTTLDLTWDFAKVGERDLALQDRVILNPRKPHDYRIKPTDPYLPPEHLCHFPGLYVRRGDAILDAPPADVEVAKGYPTFADKGPVVKGIRLTLMTARQQVALGTEVRVIHVLEAVEPGHQVYVMGPKTVYEEYVDGRRAAPPFAGVGSYDGAVMASPWADYNYEITSYRFDKAGTHTIQWKGGDPSGESVGVESNLLVVEVR